MVTVVLTREPPRNDGLRAALDHIARVVEVPLTSTSLRARDDVARAVRDVAPPRWIVVTSSRAAPFVPDARAAWPDAAVAAVGRITASALAAATVADVRVPAIEGASAVAAMIDVGPVLSMGASDSRPELSTALTSRGIACTHVACYDTVPSTLDGLAHEELSLGDVIVITAPSAWTIAGPSIRRAATVVVTGDTTADAVRQDHANVVVASRDDLARTVTELVTARGAGEVASGPQ